MVQIEHAPSPGISDIAARQSQSRQSGSSTATQPRCYQQRNGSRAFYSTLRWRFKSMIVCSCNVLSDHEIRSVVTAAGEQPLAAHQVYGCLGCSIRCGRCARAIKRIMNEALTACPV